MARKSAKPKTKKPARRKSTKSKVKSAAAVDAKIPADPNRPTDYTPELADRICAELADGRSLRGVCDAPDMPCKATVFNWMRTRPDFLDQYTRAKEESADTHADDIIDIADDGRNDWMEKVNNEGRVIGWQENGEALRRSALRVDARKWIASKLKAKRYGNNVTAELTGPKGGPIRIELVDLDGNGNNGTDQAAA